MVIAEVSILGSPVEVVPPVAATGDMWVHDLSKTLHLVNVNGGEVTTIPSPILGFDCQGMDYRAGFLWLCDKNVNKVWKVNTSDGTSSSFNLAGKLYTLAKTPDGMWLTESTSFPVDWIKVSDTGTELVRTPQTIESGDWYSSTWDGTYVWASYAFPSGGPVGPGDLLKFDPSGPSESVLATGLPPGQTFSLTFDGTNIVAVRSEFEAATSDVYTVDRVTGTSTLLGTVPAVSGGNPVAWVK